MKDILLRTNCQDDTVYIFNSAFKGVLIKVVETPDMRLEIEYIPASTEVIPN